MRVFTTSCCSPQVPSSELATGQYGCALCVFSRVSAQLLPRDRFFSPVGSAVFSIFTIWPVAADIDGGELRDPGVYIKISTNYPWAPFNLIALLCFRTCGRRLPGFVVRDDTINNRWRQVFPRRARCVHVLRLIERSILSSLSSALRYLRNGYCCSFPSCCANRRVSRSLTSKRFFFSPWPTLRN